ncbi:hypothetical protein [Larkinella sp.]|uniref:hypothetical protein n=1 Tax=Larkinella sp. TaxID=2034517 RepID=UPI003BAC3252
MTFDTPEETFDRIVARLKLGKRLTDEQVSETGVLSALLADGNRMITWIINDNGGTFPSPNVYFVDGTDVNAFAFKEDEEYFIGINEGTVLLLMKLFYRMLSHRDILPQIGDLSKEVSPPKSPDIDINEATQKKREESIFPVDSTRSQFAVALTYFAFRFILMHEYAHILKGHVDYLENKTGLAMVSDNENLTEDVGGDWIRQAIEIDADDYSAQIGYYFHIAILIDLNNRGTQTKDGLNTPEIASFAWYFSISALFRLVGSKGYSPNNFFTSLYPPPAIRTYFIGFVLQQLNIQEKYKFPDSSLNASFECEKAFAILSSEPDFYSSRLAYGPRSDEYINSIFERFEPLYEILWPFSILKRGK